jgi:hypothetical protein
VIPGRRHHTRAHVHRQQPSPARDDRPPSANRCSTDRQSRRAPAARGKSHGLRENGAESCPEQRNRAETRQIPPFLRQEWRLLRRLAGRAAFHHGLPAVAAATAAAPGSLDHRPAPVPESSARSFLLLLGLRRHIRRGALGRAEKGARLLWCARGLCASGLTLLGDGRRAVGNQVLLIDDSLARPRRPRRTGGHNRRIDRNRHRARFGWIGNAGGNDARGGSNAGCTVGRRGALAR